MRDVTERTRLVQAIRAETTAKERFFAHLSHELRTPVHAVLGYTSLLSGGDAGALPSTAAQMVGRIARSARHLRELVDDLLDLSRIAAGRVTLATEAVPLAEVVGELEPLVGPQLRAKSLAYHADVPADCMVRADRDKLVQVLLNLLSNAVKFTPSGGRVTVDCARRQDGTGDPASVFLRVADTGVGIPRDKFDAVFEPFVQVDATPAGRVGGAGLGLAISRDLARGMGGDLRVRSAMRAGTTFTVVLPRA
jgi:signal transduction histidine kinase